MILRHMAKLVLNVSFLNLLQELKRSEIRGGFKMSLLFFWGEDIGRDD